MDSKKATASALPFKATLLAPLGLSNKDPGSFRFYSQWINVSVTPKAAHSWLGLSKSTQKISKSTASLQVAGILY